MNRPLLLAALLVPALLAPATRASAQFVDAYFSPVPAVPAAGTYAPEVQALIEEGYSQLAAVSAPDDDVHLDAAETAFESALEIEPGAVHALNGIGMYELAKDVLRHRGPHDACRVGEYDRTLAELGKEAAPYAGGGRVDPAELHGRPEDVLGDPESVEDLGVGRSNGRLRRGGRSRLRTEGKRWQ